MFGIDLNTLPDQFNRATPGLHLIMDGDGPAYRIAATVKRLDTAIRNYQQEVLRCMYLTGAETGTVHFTARDSNKAGRFDVIAAKPYQGQRSGKEKPALLEPLREAMALRQNWLPEFDSILHTELEADDGMIIQAYQYGESGVVHSDDKDLMVTPYKYYRKDVGVVEGGEPDGWVVLKYTDAGKPKLAGRGLMFFWAQMLAGDKADNIAGLQRLDGKLCGDAGAVEFIKRFRSHEDAAQEVLDAYRRANQNPYPEAALLWLLRTPVDHVALYFESLNLNSDIKAFLAECRARAWCKAGSRHAAYRT